MGPVPCRARRDTPLIFAIAAWTIVLGAGGNPAQAGLIVNQWVASTCAAISSVDKFERDGCNTSSPGPHSSDRKTHSSPGTAISSVSLSGARASAFQRAGGFNGAAAQARSDDVGFEVAAASAAGLGLSVINTGADPIPITFRFLITGAELSLDLSTDFRAPSGEVAPIAEVFANITTFHGGVEGSEWFYKATLIAVNADTSAMLLEELVIDPQGIGKPVVTVDRSIGAARVTLSAFAGNLFMGALAPDTGLGFAYVVGARVFTGQPVPFFDPQSPPTTAAVAWIEDPFGLDGDLTLPPVPADGFSLNGQSLASLVAAPEAPPSGVPLPATLLLFTGGIGCVVLTRRLRESSDRARGG